MILTANEGKQQHAFFIPQLGPAPKWCSFLDNLVEEIGEDPNEQHSFSTSQSGSVYDNYKFLTMSQLRTLNLDHLVGRTTLLRPYMHGYFVAQRLYEEARLIANPFIWEEERAKRVKEKIDQERESRIRGKKKAIAKVNKKLAEKLLEKEEKVERRRAKRVLEKGGDGDDVEAAIGDVAPAAETPEGLLRDSRFAKLFEDEEFAVDETSREFLAINPGTIPTVTETQERGLTAVEEEAIDDVPGSSSDESPSDREQPVKNKSTGRISTPSYRRKKGSTPRMQISSSSRTTQARDRSFESRMRKSRTKTRVSRVDAVGEKEVTFTPQARSRPKPASDRENGKAPRAKDRRSASGNTFRRM
jgi:ribosome biogenesis protein ENP2